MRLPKLRVRAWLSRQRWRDLLPKLLVVIGAVLLAYVAYAYTSMFTSQHRLEQDWRRQQISSGPAAPPVDAKNALTRLMIPKISLDAVVVEGTKYRQLAVAPGHLEGTAMPGEDGNAVISAHRDTFFRHIYELQKGDTILVRRLGKTYTYEVTSKRVVQPDDISVTKPTKDAQLTLLTCYPTYYVGPAPERLVVFAKLVQLPAGNTAQARSAAP
jgi:sortase A